MTTTGYVFEQHAQSSDDSFGSHIIKPSVQGVAVWKPSWEGHSVMRLFPGILPEATPSQPMVAPYRVGPGLNQFGDWIRKYPAAIKIGTPPITFLVRNTASSDILDDQTSPLAVLHRNITQAVAQGACPGAWAPYTISKPGEGKVLDKIKDLFLVQGCFMVYKGKACNPPKGAALNDDTVVIQLTSSAGDRLLEQLNQGKDGYSGDPRDYINSMLHGDPVGLHPGAGRYVTFFKQGEDPRERQRLGQGGMNPGAMFGVAADRGGDRGGGFKGYDCYLEPSWNGMPADLSNPATASFIYSKIKRWDDILFFPTFEEQAKLLATRFPPDMIIYAWRDHPEWIPESVREAARRQSAVPQGVLPGMAAPPDPRAYMGGFAQQPGNGYSQPAPFGAAPAAPAFGSPPAAPSIAPPAPAFGAQPAAPGFATPQHYQQAPAFAPPQQSYPQPAGPAFGVPPQAPQQAPQGSPQGFGAPAVPYPQQPAPGFAPQPTQATFGQPQQQAPFAQPQQAPFGQPAPQMGAGYPTQQPQYDSSLQPQQLPTANWSPPQPAASSFATQQNGQPSVAGFDPAPAGPPPQFAPPPPPAGAMGQPVQYQQPQPQPVPANNRMLDALSAARAAANQPAAGQQQAPQQAQPAGFAPPPPQQGFAPPQHGGFAPPPQQGFAPPQQ